ncbi:ribonuclease H1-like isoform X2 [Pecten maximus]|uniref:ribonuclease H1-like isoform X2 n=1 Tax=Pecten maximus TaxID=6579 RepID=UPI001457E779|nr:ribonuclease H1-like isoform X2 [Pecten maximus]
MNTFYRLVTMPFYAVRRGKMPGIYKTWDECKAQVNGFPKARYKKFSTESEANDFVNDTTADNGSSSFAGGYSQQQKKYPSHTATASNHMSHTSAPFSHRQPMQKVPSTSNSESFNDTDFDGEMKNVYKIEYTKTVHIQPPVSRGSYPRSRGTESRSRGAQSMSRGAQSMSRGAQSRPRGAQSTSRGAQSRPRGAQSRSKNRWSRTQQRTNRNENSQGNDIVVYTDGGCYNNGQRGAQAGIGVYWGPSDPRNVSERLSGRQTNNRAEIHAACRAIEQAKAQGFQEITIKTDSQFLISAATQWISGWQRKNWTLSDGGPVKNKDDFIHLNRVSEGMNVKWIHVRGHTGIAGNEAADRLANEGALKPLP